MSTTALTPAFISRIYDYPIVNSTCSKVAAYYTDARDQAGVVAGGLHLAETGVRKFTGSAAPTLTRLEHPISRLDQLVCQQLDRLESKYPLVQQPSEEVLKESRKFYNDKLDSKVQLVLHPVNATFDTVAAVRQRSLQSARGVRDYGYEKSKHLGQYGAHQWTSYGQYAAAGLERLISNADSAVDHYLPATAAETAQSTAGPRHSGARAAQLTKKVRDRVYLRALRDIENVRSYSAERIQKMSILVDLIAFSKAHLSSVKGAALKLQRAYIDKLASLDKTMATSLEDAKTSPSRLLQIAQHYAEQLRMAAQATSSIAYEHLPGQLQLHLQESQVQLTAAYHRVVAAKQLSDWSDAVQQEIRHRLCAANSALEAAKSALLPSWLSQQPKEQTDNIELNSRLESDPEGKKAPESTGSDQQRASCSVDNDE